MNYPVTEKQRRHIEEFDCKIRNGDVQVEWVDCLCGESEFQILATTDRYRFSQQTVICKQCGLIRSNPRMTEESYRKFYESETYRNCYEGEGWIDRYQTFYNPEYSQHIFDTISNEKKDVKSVLEIGAGGGWNLVPFKEARIETVGYEYSPALVKLGEKNGISVVKGGVEDVKGTYDVIILNHVVEHMMSPVEEVRKIAELLNDNGVIYIAVPTMDNYSPHQLQNAHTYYFNRKTLEHYMQKAGLIASHIKPAEIVHISGVFKRGKSPTYSLDSNYSEQVKVIKNGYIIKRIKRCIRGVRSAVKMLRVLP